MSYSEFLRNAALAGVSSTTGLPPIPNIATKSYVDAAYAGQYISAACKFWYPGVQDTSGNAADKSYHGGSATKSGTNSAANAVFDKKILVSGAGTLGGSGTGRWFAVPSSASNHDYRTESCILHFIVNKATPSGTEYILGNQNNGTCSGFAISVNNTGAITVYYRMGSTTQNNFTVIPSVCDGTDNAITIAINRSASSPTVNAYIFLNGNLLEQKTFSGANLAPNGVQGMSLGASYLANAAFNCKLTDVQFYAFQKDLIDINVQACVDKMVLHKRPLAVVDLGV